MEFARNRGFYGTSRSTRPQRKSWGHTSHGLLLPGVLWTSFVACTTGHVEGPRSSSPVGQLHLETKETHREHTKAEVEVAAATASTHGPWIEMQTHCKEAEREDGCSSALLGERAFVGPLSFPCWGLQWNSISEWFPNFVAPGPIFEIDTLLGPT